MSPCYQCADRYPGCHQSCERHAAWKAGEDRRKTAILEARNRERQLDNYNADNAAAWKRRKA